MRCPCHRQEDFASEEVLREQEQVLKVSLLDPSQEIIFSQEFGKAPVCLHHLPHSSQRGAASQLYALCSCFFSPQILLMQYQSVYVFTCACSQLLLTYASAIAQIISVMSKASVLFAMDELVDGGALLPKDAFIVRFRTDAKHSRLTFLSAITDPEERVIQLEAMLECAAGPRIC